MRRIRLCAALLSTTIAILAQTSVQTQRPTVLRADEFQLTDQNGVVRATLKIGDSKAPGLTLFNSNGDVAAYVGTAHDRGFIAIADEKGLERAQMSISSDGPVLALRDANEKLRLVLRISSTGNPRITMLDEKSTPRVNIFLNEKNVIEVGDAQGKLVWKAPPEAEVSAVVPSVPSASSGRQLSGSVFPGSAVRVYSNTGSGHWIQDVSSNGRLVTLEDDSLWEINSLDQIDTALWLPTTDIVVQFATNPVGEYKYVLINKDDGEKALAKYLGK